MSDTENKRIKFFEEFFAAITKVSDYCGILECEDCPMYLEKKCELNIPFAWDIDRAKKHLINKNIKNG